jgi:hypothetical protein
MLQSFTPLQDTLSAEAARANQGLGYTQGVKARSCLYLRVDLHFSSKGSIPGVIHVSHEPLTLRLELAG